MILGYLDYKQVYFALTSVIEHSRQQIEMNSDISDKIFDNLLCLFINRIRSGSGVNYTVLNKRKIRSAFFYHFLNNFTWLQVISNHLKLFKTT